MNMPGFFGRLLDNYATRIIKRVADVKNIFLSGGFVVFIGIVSIWLSIFLYVAFYNAYMPHVMHVRPVNIQFQPCEETKGICSFPTAHVQLTKKQQLLMIGQRYKMYLYLDMPESPANQHLGMFMVCAHLEDRSGTLVTNACRSAMLHYRSYLLHILHTLIFSPPLLFGSSEEKQTVVVELFTNFEEDPAHPVTHIYLELQSRHIEVYSSEIRIVAHLSGLRHLMFHWPTFSAGVGVVSILFFLTVLIALSWCHHVLRSEGNRSSQENADWPSDDVDLDETFQEEDFETEKDQEKSTSQMTGDIDDTLKEDDIYEEMQARGSFEYEEIENLK